MKFINNFAEECGGELASANRVEQDALGYARSRTASRKVSMARKRSIFAEIRQAMIFLAYRPTTAQT